MKATWRKFTFICILVFFCVFSVVAQTDLQLPPSIDLRGVGIDPNAFSKGTYDKRLLLPQNMKALDASMDAIMNSIKTNIQKQNAANKAENPVDSDAVFAEYQKLIMQFAINYYPQIIHASGEKEIITEGMQSIAALDSGDSIAFVFLPDATNNAKFSVDDLSSQSIYGLSDLVESINFSLMNYSSIDVSQPGITLTKQQSIYGLLPGIGFNIKGISPYNQHFLSGKIVDGDTILRIQIKYKTIDRYFAYYVSYKTKYRLSLIGFNAYYLTDLNRLASVISAPSDSFRGSNVTAALWLFKSQWNSYKDGNKISISVSYPLIYPVLADSAVNVDTGLGLGIGLNLNEKLSLGIGFDFWNFAPAAKKYGVNILFGTEIVSLFSK